MRNWRVLVKSSDGRRFSTRAIEISAERAVVRGDWVLPNGMVCDLQLVIPPQTVTQLAGEANLQAEVSEVVFSSWDIHLDFRIKSLSSEARKWIESRSPVVNTGK
jgi:hypothetical protein